MVVQAMVQLAIAGPVGILFGLGYGTAIRVGYEIVFPALFGDKEIPKDSSAVLSSIEKMFTNIGGLEAHKFGINQGIKNALQAIDADSELVDLIKKNSNLGSQSITVNLSGSSKSPLLEDTVSEPSQPSLSKPPGTAFSILAYVQALANAAKNNDKRKYSDLINQIGLSDESVYTLVKNGQVTVETGGYKVNIQYGMLLLEIQRDYALRFNKINEAKLATVTTSDSNLLGGVKPLYLRSVQAAGQSQRLEKETLIRNIRIMNQKIVNKAQYSPEQQKDNLKRLHNFRQSLANLLAWYRF